MEDWKKYKLGDLLTIKYGKDHKKPKEGNIPVYGSGGIMRQVNQSIYNVPSIMIPRKGSLNSKRDFANLNVGSAVPSLTVPILNDIDVNVPT